MTQYHFVYSSTLPFSASQVIAWHKKTGALRRLLPPWRSCKILLCEGGPDHKGSHVALQLSFAGVKWKWVLEHRGFLNDQEFVDEQIKGPFSHYRHTHRFLPVTDQSCKIEDEVDYRLPLGIPVSFFHKEWAKLFRWRHRVIHDDLSLISRYPTPPLRILLSGASGLIGSSLCALLRTAGHQVIPLVRGQKEGSVGWDPVHENFRKEDFEGFDAVIHLAGENIAAGRWTPERKKRLFLSRCRDTWLLSQILARTNNPPKTVICASALGYYGNRPSEKLTEASHRGEGFLADLCFKWEEATRAMEQKGIRVLNPRFGIVLSGQGGMLQRLLLPYCLGLGGKLGSGQQAMSWIGIDDAIGALYHLLMTSSLRGAVNIVAPQAVRQEEFARELAKKLRRPSFFSLPKWLLRKVFGEMADELILSDVDALPKKLIETGYTFRYPILAEALDYVM